MRNKPYKQMSEKMFVREGLAMERRVRNLLARNFDPAEVAAVLILPMVVGMRQAIGPRKTRDTVMENNQRSNRAGAQMGLSFQRPLRRKNQPKNSLK